jgi:hypothetical protein
MRDREIAADVGADGCLNDMISNGNIVLIRNQNALILLLLREVAGIKET